MKPFATVAFILMLLLAGSRALSQTVSAPLVSGAFTNLTATQFLDELESKTKYRFFYDSTQLDSIRITVTVSNQTIDKALELAFANTDIGFSIDNENHVFISKGLLVQTQWQSNATAKKITSRDSLEEVNSKNIHLTTSEDKLYIIGDQTPANNSQPMVSGYVRDAKTSEPVVGAFVYVDNTKTNTITDQYGYFSVAVTKGNHVLSVQSIGMYEAKRKIMVRNSGSIDIGMQSQVMALKRVIVSSEKINNIRNLQMGSQKIDIKAIKQVPVAFGEADILRVVLTLPGVKSVGEASTGLNVRGGSADQNLILFNDATIYNPSHFFGLFSAFNPDVVKDVELYKAGIPAQYGGRLSSVLNINSREGNKERYTGSAGIGLLTSRFNLEGPIKKEKSSFIIGGRATYANWLLGLLPDQYKNSKAGFYDANMILTQEINKNNSLFITGYISNDRFNLNSDTSYRYGNTNGSVKWKHLFSNKLNMLITTGYDYYHYKIASNNIPINAYSLSFNVNQANLKAHFNYYLNNQHTLQFGVSNIYYKLNPGNYEPDGKESLVKEDRMQAEQGVESAVYLSDKYSISNAFSVEGGIRYSLFNFLGPYKLNVYPPGVNKTEDNIVDSAFFTKGKIIKTYGAPEFRLSARYAFNNTFSMKASYNSQRQYIHMLSNTAAMAPTDIWKLSDPNIKPQSGNQISLGLYKNLKSNTVETSVEVYYKKINNYLDYKSGAVLVLNHHIETDVIGTKGKAYGAELLIKKTEGKLNGWISYTYSRTLLKADSSVGEIINGGKYYPANYDKPHDVTVIGNYRVNHRFSISLNTTYSTGRPITLPIGRFWYAGSERTLYAARNAYRIPDYFRTDFSLNIDGNHKVHQKFHNSFTIGVYNATGRKNPYSVYFTSENGVVNGYKLSVFGSAIPYINYNIRF